MASVWWILRVSSSPTKSSALFAGELKTDSRVHLAFWHGLPFAQLQEPRKSAEDRGPFRPAMGMRKAFLFCLGPPVVPFLTPFFGWEFSPTKINYRKQGTLIQTSLLEDLVAFILMVAKPISHHRTQKPNQRKYQQTLWFQPWSSGAHGFRSTVWPTS